MNVGTLTANLILATGEFDKALTGAGNKLRSFGAQVTQAGRDMMVLTAPIAAVGAGAIKTGMNFESAFAKIEGLVGITGTELAGLKARVLELSGTTAKSPVELAEALYYLTSSGMSAAEASEVLEVAAKGSTVGLGTTQVVAKAAAFAINAYRDSGMTAATATDILTAAVKYGTIEADEMAPVMGRLLPIASELDISYSQVAGTLAVMSRTGLDAAEAATSMSSIFSNLVKPSVAAREVLAGVGLSMGELRDVASREPDGVIQVYRLLNDTLNEEQFSVVVPNVRAMRGAMNFLAQETESVDEVMQGVHDSTGALDHAFEITSQTAEFQLNQTLADMQTALLDIWVVIREPLINVLKDLSKFIKDAATWFKGLDDGTKKMIVTVGALLVALGPLLIVFGSLFKVIGTVVSGFGSLIGGIGNVMKMLPMLMSPIGLFIVAASALAMAIIGVATAADNGRKAAHEYLDEWEKLNGVMDEATDIQKAVEDGSKALHDKYSVFKQDLVGSVALMLPLIGQLKQQELAQGEAAAQTELAAEAQKRYNDSIILSLEENQAAALEKTKDAFNKAEEALRAMPEAFEMTDNAAKLLSLQLGVTESTVKGAWAGIQHDAEAASEGVREALMMIAPDAQLTEQDAEDLAAQYGVTSEEVVAAWQEMQTAAGIATVDMGAALGDFSEVAELAWQKFGDATHYSTDDVASRIEVLQERLRELNEEDMQELGPSAEIAWRKVVTATATELGGLGGVVDESLVQVNQAIEDSADKAVDDFVLMAEDVTAALESLEPDSDKAWKDFKKSMSKGSDDSVAEVKKLEERLDYLGKVKLSELGPDGLAAWTAMYNATKTKLDLTNDFIDNKGEIIEDIIPTALTNSNAAANVAWDDLFHHTSDVTEDIVETVETAADDTADAMPDALKDRYATTASSLDKVYDKTSGTFEDVTDKASDESEDAAAQLPTELAQSLNPLGTALNNINSMIGRIMSALTTAMGQHGENIASAWVNRMVTRLRNAQGEISAAANYATAGLQGNSPPKVGPLKEISNWARNVAQAWIIPFQDMIRSSGVLDTLQPTAMLGRVNASTAPGLVPVVQRNFDRGPGSMGGSSSTYNIYGMQPGDVEREITTAQRRLAFDWELNV